MHAPEADIAKYRGAYDEGYPSIRKARYEKAIEMGVIDKKWEMSKGLDWKGFEHKAWDIRCMEVYAAMDRDYGSWHRKDCQRAQETKTL